MNWKQKAKKLYDKVAHGVMRYTAPLLMMLPSFGSARSAPNENKDDIPLNTKKYEATIAQDATEDVVNLHPLLYNPKEYQDISYLDMEKVAEKVSQMTLGEVLQKGLISQEQLQAYQFSADDFKQMKPGKLGQKLKSALEKSCTGSPQGKCLESVRECAGEALGVNVWTPSGLAKDWPESVAESDMPVAFLGKVVVEEKKDGKLEDHGNIKLQDLLYLRAAIAVIDGNNRNVNGKQQKAGHVSLILAMFDKTGKRVATISLCDGRENYETVVNKKIGGGKRRYGNIVTVMMPNDVQLSKGLAEYVVQKMLERTSNAVELCAMISPQEDILHKYLKNPYDQIMTDFSEQSILARLNRVKAKEQEHNKKIEPVERNVAQAQTKKGKTGVSSKIGARSVVSRQLGRS